MLLLRCSRARRSLPLASGRPEELRNFIDEIDEVLTMDVVPGTINPPTSDQRVEFTNSPGHRIIHDATPVDVAVEEQRPTGER